MTPAWPSWPLRFTTWIVLVSHVLSPFSPQILAAERNTTVPPAAVPTPSHPAPVITPPSISVNRTVPKVQPPSQELRFSESPTDEEIFKARVFSEPIIDVGANKSGSVENKDLAQALLAFRNRATPEDASALEQFLSKYPASPKRASVLLGAASAYRRTGQLTKAFDAWKEAWALSKNATGARSKAVAEQTAAELSLFIVSIGRTEPLRDLLAELRGREIGGSAGEKVVRAREALWQMQNLPDQSFKCGPFSLYRIRANLSLPDAAHKLIWDEQSTSQGTTLAQMWSLAQRMGMDYQMARRQPGAAVLYPSMMHWKLGHFSAVVREQDGRYLIEDTAFGDQIWISRQVLDAEANGYFLIPAGKLPAGWTSVSEEEAKTVWGRMTPTTRDDDATTPDDKKDCPTRQPPPPQRGMPEYAIHLMQVSLNIVDVPVGYTPPRGPAVDFVLTYNQREANQPGTFAHSNLGKKWTFDWLSYVEDEPTTPNANVKVYVRGGGAESFRNFDTNTQSFAVQQKSQARLVRTSTNSYEKIYPDGSKEIFNVANGATTPRRVYMNVFMDAAGNGCTNTYDANFRIMSVTDALGQVTILEYASTNSGDPNLFYKIIKVTDPFGRYATFQYNASGQLTNITDVIGMSSSFVYGASDFITSLTTPYGTTSFAKYEYDVDRWLEATEPDGEKKRVEFKYVVPAMTNSEPLFPTGLATTNEMNAGLSAWNTFVWDKKAMREAPGDYFKAHVTHWLSSSDSFYVVSGIPQSEKAPLEGRIWYNYPGQTHGRMSGTSDQPSHIARVLDDGTTQLTQLNYNTNGRVTKVIDPVGRTTLLTYATNGIDLLEVRQQVGSTNELLGSFSYNATHLPLTAVDAAGQTNRFGYNSYGQLTAMTNALNEVTSLSYSNAYLTNVTGALPGATTSFTYDGYGRVRTITDSEGYTLTYDYDVLDRPTKITYLDGTFEQVVYEKLDPVFRKDRRGHWSRTIYNAVRQPTAIEDAAGRITHFQWCGCGSLESITDPLGRTTTWFRDLQGRPTSKLYPDNTTITYGYEAWTSRLKSITDAKNQTTWHAYAKENNPIQVSYSNAVVATPSVSFTYDTNYNRLLAIVDGIGTNAYSYHAVSNTVLGSGRLATVDGPLANDTITYTYDELGRVKTRAIDGTAQSMTYDALGRVTVLTNVLGNFTNRYVNATARPSTNFYPNGQKTVFSYYGASNDFRLQQIQHSILSTQLSAFSYSYDADGQIATWTQQADSGTPKVHVFEYDPVDQLLAATVRSNSVAGAILKRHIYGYDKAGNRTSEQIENSAGLPLAVATAAHNDLNQLTSTAVNGPVRFKGSLDELGIVTIAGSAAPLDSRTTNFVGYAQASVGTNVVPVIATDYSNNSRTNNYQIVVTNNGVARTLAYDLNGNLTNAVTAPTTNSYEWDAEDRLVAINTGMNRSEFTYDGLSRLVRIVEKTNGTAQSTNWFVWCGTERCEERDNTGATVTKRFFGQGEEISGTNYFFTSDHLGSIREMTDGTGAVRARYEYDPYGRVAKVSGDLTSDFRYTGHYYHAPSGLHLAPFRAYDAETGRWISRDPIQEEGGLNLYAYVSNDPVNGVDPLGLYLSSLNTPQGQMALAWAMSSVIAGVAVRGVSDLSTQLGERSVTKCPIDGGQLGSQMYNAPAMIWDAGMGVIFAGAANLILLRLSVGGLTAAKTAPNLKHLDDVLDEAARLEKQWPQQMKALQESGQVLNMAKKADVKYIDYLQKKYKFGNDSRELLHEMITKQKLSKKQIEQVARDLKGGK